MNEENIIQNIRSKNTENIFLVFLSGVFSEKFSDINLLPKELIIQQSDVSGFNIRLIKNTKLEKSLHVLFLQTENEKSVSLHNHILVEESSELSLIIEYVACDVKKYSVHSTIEIIAQKKSCIHYHKIQNEDKSAIHLATAHIKQASDSEVNCFSLMVGGQQVRDDLNVEQNESGSRCQLYGFYQLTQDNQEVEHHLYANHLAQHGQSKMLYKGILDKKSRALFNGKVYVHESAQKINAFQANHNLLLSNDVEASSKPELEIYANDVKCAHAATVGQLDQEALFYLQARGIDSDAAKKFLLQAFADEVIRAIVNPAILQYVRGFI